MKWSLPALLLSLATRAIAHDVLSLYVSYLHEHGKDINRAGDPSRVTRFAASLRAVYDCSLSSKSYKCKVNEYSDWLEEEVDSLYTKHSIERQDDKTDSSASSAATGALHNDSDSATMGSSASFLDSLNWMSTDNPVGSPVISSIRNQGQCGACWAFVSAAAIEASVRINTGQAVPLSVQQLVDCDNKRNKGCDGGNPVFAYDYVMTNGLERWNAYPYTEKHSLACQISTGGTKSFIKNYVKIPTKNQKILKDFVRASPVSVGLCGTDETFLYYSSGVYDEPDCCTTQNHALLIVGYGHDNTSNLDYWVAMNSWGSRWGDRGFMQLKRSADDSGSGQCGVAQSPSAAIGGFIVHTDDPDDIEQYRVWLNVVINFFRDNWVFVALLASLLLSIYSVVLVLYMLLSDHIEWLRRRRASASDTLRLSSPLPKLAAAYGSVNNEDDV